MVPILLGCVAESVGARSSFEPALKTSRQTKRECYIWPDPEPFTRGLLTFNSLALRSIGAESAG